jgi:hypothetical protein
MSPNVSQCVPVCASVCRCVPVCASVCQCVPVCASVCQCVPVCASACRFEGLRAGPVFGKPFICSDLCISTFIWRVLRFRNGTYGNYGTYATQYSDPALPRKCDFRRLRVPPREGGVY